MPSEFYHYASEMMAPQLMDYFAGHKVVFFRRENRQPVELLVVLDDKEDRPEIDPENGNEVRLEVVQAVVETPVLADNGIDLVAMRTEVEIDGDQYIVYRVERNDSFTTLTLARGPLTRFAQVEGEAGGPAI